MSVTTQVALTDAELMLLDSRCSDAVQAEIDAAKMRERLTAAYGLPEPLTHVLSAILRAAANGGEVVAYREKLSTCFGCGKRAGYATVKRSGRYKRKGELDYDKPLYLSAVEYIPRFIRVTGVSSTAVCHECALTMRAALVDELDALRVQVPASLRADGAPARTKHRNMCCKKCGWQGHEGQMKQSRTMMNDGWYPSGCPNCDGTNTWGRTDIEFAEGFTITEEST